MPSLKKLIFLLSNREKKNAVILMIMILFMAFLDVIGVASIMPFIAVLTNPNLIETNAILNMIFEYSSTFGIENSKQFLFFLGILVFILLFVSLAFKTFTIYLQLRFIQNREYTIGKRLVEGYLHQPYSWFLNRNSADLDKSILSEVATTVSGGISPMMEFIAKGLTSIALLIFLVFIDPKLAIIISFTLGASYLIIYKFTRGFLNQIGRERLKANNLRFLSLSEAFGAIKEVKVNGLEKNYIKKFSEPARIYARHMASSMILTQIPRFLLEAIAFGGMLLVILYLMGETGTFTNALPIIALYSFAGYRLMPAIQQMYSSAGQLRFVGPAVDALYEDLKNLQSINLNEDQDILQLNKSISLNKIYFNYPNTSRTALKNISLNIPAGSKIGLVGATGSGKTTIVDIILGLLETQRGTLEVDGKIIKKENSRTWQKSIGYVPQNIYLSDDSIAANIAFGTDLNDLKTERVERSAKIANLHEFVINELPNKYQTTVGERGVRLSGGQRQRIGIARALYHNPKLLILDEATSALDNLTEKIVMEKVNNFSKDMTTILIAHRLSTVKDCDIIFLIEEGQIIGQGTFEELMKVNNRFRETVENN